MAVAPATVTGATGVVAVAPPVVLDVPLERVLAEPVVGVPLPVDDNPEMTLPVKDVTVDPEAVPVLDPLAELVERLPMPLVEPLRDPEMLPVDDPVTGPVVVLEFELGGHAKSIAELVSTKHTVSAGGLRLTWQD